MSETAPTAASGAESTPRQHADKQDVRTRRGPVGRIALFVRQVVGELKKVVYPTRPDLVTYTTVVLVFVVVVMAFVTVLDLGIGRLTFWIFGG